MFRKAALVLGVIFLLVQGVRAQEGYAPDKTYTATELQKDYDEVVKALLAVHPGLLSFQTFNEFRYKATITRAKIGDGMSDEDFYKIVSGLVNEVRCGHTFILPSLASIEYHKDKAINFPLVLEIEEGNATVEQVFRKEEEFLVGKKILGIDGFEWESIRDSLWDYVPADGFIETRKDYLLGHNFEFFYRLFYGKRKAFEVQLEDTMVLLEPISYKQIAEAKKPTPLLKHSKKEGTAYLKLNSFAESKTFKKDIKKTFKKIIKDDPDELVIDLRENDGGSTENMIYVLAYLLDEPFTIFDTIRVKNKAALEAFFSDKKQKKHYIDQIVYDSLSRQYYWNDEHNLATHQPRKKLYQGKLTLLIGGGTFSSAVHFVACLLNNKEVQLKGVETGGFADHNNGGVIPKIVLPATKLRLAVPLFQGKYHTEFDFIYGRGIKPQHPLESAVTD